jgi:predicted nucleotidyltransferase
VVFSLTRPYSCCRADWDILGIGGKIGFKGNLMSDGITSQSSTAEKRLLLLQSELTRWLPLLIQQLNPERVILFGSLTQDQVHDWSDIDLVIVRETTQPFLKRVQEAMLLLKPKVGLDILIYTPEEFAELKRDRRFVQEEIVKKGKLLYERK